MKSKPSGSRRSPFLEYTTGLTDAQALAFFKDYDALAVKNGFDAAIGPAMMNATDSPAQADLLADILLNTKKINGSVWVGAEDGVRWPAVGRRGARHEKARRHRT